jgi:hypothetical protein
MVAKQRQITFVLNPSLRRNKIIESKTLADWRVLKLPISHCEVK